MLFNNTTEKWYLEGIASFVIVTSSNGCNATRPNYYTAVGYYNDYITDIVKI
jgi:hypothetical protein